MSSTLGKDQALRSSIMIVATLGLALGVGLGCEERPETASERLQSELDELRSVDRALLPVSEDYLRRLETYAQDPQAHADELDELLGEDALSLAEQRRRQYREAADHLSDMLGDDPGNVGLAQVLADLHAYLALAHAREAELEQAAVQARTRTLQAYLQAIERAQRRIRQSSRDSELLLEQLNEEIRQQRRDRDDVAEQIEDVEATLADLRSRRDDYQQDARQALQRWQTAREEAFAAEGEERFDLEEQADQRQRDAEQLEVQADKLDAEMDTHESELAALQRRAAVIEELIGELESQVSTVERHDAGRAERRAAAEQRRDAAAEALAEEFDELMSVHRSAVREPFDRARDRMDQAVEVLNQAHEHSRDRSLEESLLTRRMDQVRLLSDQIAAAGSLGRTVRTLHQRAAELMPDAAGRFEDVYEELVARQRRLSDEADDASAHAESLIAEMEGREEQLAELAQRRSQRLTAYRDQISRATLD